MRCSAALLAAAAGCDALRAGYASANGRALWADFKAAHGKVYASADEEGHRYAIFEGNMRAAAAREAENPGAAFGASKFADLTKEEFKRYHNLRVPRTESPPPAFSQAQVASALAGSVDWRARGAVTQVKDQGGCGACWAFSATGGIEAQWFLAGHPLTSVSEMEIIACDKVDSACDGGLTGTAYDYLLSKGGKIVTEKAYPYTAGGCLMGCSYRCKGDAGKPVGAVISGQQRVAHTEEQMAAYVAVSGPLPISVDASSDLWQTYKHGVISKCAAGPLDHSVLAVGYSSEYWIVKNSWGSSWGEHGYIRLAFGTNQCGIKYEPLAPIVAGAPTPPPSPPSPPSPADGFTQTVCTDKACSRGCVPADFAVGECLALDDGSSEVVESCNATGMAITVYRSASCTGAVKKRTTDPVGKCVKDGSGVFYENACLAAPPAAARAPHVLPRRVLSPAE